MKTQAAMKIEATQNTSQIAARAQWMRETCKGQTTLGFKAWYDVKLEALLDSWMTK